MTLRSFTFIVACLCATFVLGIGQSWFFGSHTNLVQIVDQFIDGDRRDGGVQRNFSPHCLTGICPRVALRTTMPGPTGTAESAIRAAAGRQGFEVEYAGDWYLANRSDVQVKYRVVRGADGSAVIEWQASPSF